VTADNVLSLTRMTDACPVLCNGRYSLGRNFSPIVRVYGPQYTIWRHSVRHCSLLPGGHNVSMSTAVHCVKLSIAFETLAYILHC